MKRMNNKNGVKQNLTKEGFSVMNNKKQNINNSNNQVINNLRFDRTSEILAIE